MRIRPAFVLALSSIFFVTVQTVCQPKPGQPARWGSDQFLDSLQYRTFQFFWKTTPENNGLTPDRYPTPSFSSIAAVGFALTAYPIGVERGYVTREEARKRVLATLRFFWNSPQSPDATNVTGYKGFYYHFLDPKTGYRFKTVELSSIDTSLLLAGVLFVQSYFDSGDPEEKEIRALADSLYKRVDWKWFRPRPPLVSMGWHPEDGFNKSDWTGYMESMILYVLALGSPTHPVEPEAWEKWTSTYIWAEYYGHEFISFGPLFGHQYSHSWIDFSGIQDAYMRKRGIDYAENSRRATYSQQAYAADNPHGWKGYSDSIWGISACDGPGDVTMTLDGIERNFVGYAGRGVSFDWALDDGTLTPTAAGGSLPFAPEICVPALKAMKELMGERLWGEFGFRDAFNPTYVDKDHPGGWVDRDYLGIDQGPILIMAENLRTGLVWKTMKKNPYIREGLRKAGFTGGWLNEIPKK